MAKKTYTIEDVRHSLYKGRCMLKSDFVSSNFYMRIDLLGSIKDTLLVSRTDGRMVHVLVHPETDEAGNYRLYNMCNELNTEQQLPIAEKNGLCLMKELSELHPDFLTEVTINTRKPNRNRRLYMKYIQGFMEDDPDEPGPCLLWYNCLVGIDTKTVEKYFSHIDVEGTLIDIRQNPLYYVFDYSNEAKREAVDKYLSELIADYGVGTNEVVYIQKGLASRNKILLVPRVKFKTICGIDSKNGCCSDDVLMNLYKRTTILCIDGASLDESGYTMTPHTTAMMMRSSDDLLCMDLISIEK